MVVRFSCSPIIIIEMADLKIKTMRDGLPVVLQNKDEMPDGTSFTESWDRLSDTVTVTMVEKFVVGKDPKLTVLKFDRVQYEALLRAIRKLNP